VLYWERDVEGIGMRNEDGGKGVVRKVNSKGGLEKVAKRRIDAYHRETTGHRTTRKKMNAKFHERLFEGGNI
jgi:hypothetical protein